MIINNVREAGRLKMFPPGRLIPVMDVRHGQLVHARAGQRQTYGALHSPLVGRTLQHTAVNLLRAAGSTRLYVADLDALLGEPPSEAVTQLLHELTECEILLDRGRQLFQELPNHVRPVLPLEAGWSPSEHAELIQRFQGWRPLFSLDLWQGRWLGGYQSWAVSGPEEFLALVAQVYEVGYRAFVLLDLAQVGTGSGVDGICPFVRSIRRHWPEVEIVAGGGVRHVRDCQLLLDAGADGILVATALHRGQWSDFAHSPAGV
jgi:phosphoribosylformimino-5-aminoimidazole carboxamide ribotide isomerase